MSRIVCPSCGEGIAPENVELSTRLAKCRCGNVFELTSQLRTGDAPAEGARRRDLVAPAGWTVEAAPAPARIEPGYRLAASAASEPLVLSRRWFRAHAVFFAFFCVAWDSFLVFWYSTALRGVAGGAADAGLWIMLVFPIAHVAVGVGLTYYTLALFVNRTVVRLEGREASVVHGPLPWRGTQRVSLSGLRGVFVRQEITSTRGRGQQSWSVLLDTDANAAHVLVKGLPSEQDARFVAAHVAERERVSGP